MHKSMDRRRFLGVTLGGLSSLGIVGKGLAQPGQPGRLSDDLVLEFVSAAHTDLSKTEKLLEKEPALARAAWDWGRGDWETGLGGAAHTGSVHIVRFLLDHGARMDLFAAAVLGELSVVKAVVEAFPSAIDVPGPHGIPLIEHAKFGGKNAEPVVEYLMERGAKERDLSYEDLPLTEEEQKRYLGTYDADHRRGLSLVVTLEEGRLHGQPTGSPKLPLYYQGKGVFWAPEAEATLAFGLEGKQAKTVRVKQFDLDVPATRREP